MIISRQHVEILRQWAKAAHPAECCGLLYGVAGRIEDIELTANVAADPKRHFEIDPARLIGAMRGMREGAKQLLGYFHSHPTSGAEPSQRDLDGAQDDGRLWLILSHSEIRTWHVQPSKSGGLQFVEVEMLVEG